MSVSGKRVARVAVFPYTTTRPFRSKHLCYVPYDETRIVEISRGYFFFLFDLIHFTMERKLILGIRQRAEKGGKRHN